MNFKGVWQLRRNEKGFTLVELLVVISIIGVLATLVLLQLGTARARARDTKRITDVNQLRTAVEQYFEDNGGVYPPDIVGTGCPTSGTICKYLTKVPMDPLDGTKAYGYAIDPGTNPKKYQIWTTLEQTAAALNGDSDIDSSSWAAGNKVNGDDTSCKTDVTKCIYDQGVQQ